MSRHLLFAASMIATALLAGCAGTPNRGLESVHQPVVSRTDYSFDATVGNDRLAPGEAGRFGGWLASIGIGYGDRVALDDPTGSNADPGTAVPPGVRDDVAAELGRYGMLLSDDAAMIGARAAPGTIRIIVTRMTARVPGCPDFSRVRVAGFEGDTASNQGCASNSNLAAMVASPGDLVRGQPGAEINDPAVATKAIDTFRKMAPSGAAGLKAETTGGK